jgi:predicted Fe-Mo cluster-binding NifX family protein
MMRIAVASDDGQTVAGHAGRCACFVVFEVEDAAITAEEVAPNRHTAHAQGKCSGEDHEHGHGAGHGALLDLLGGCRALISRGMGPRLRMDLAERGIEAVICAESDARRAAELFARGALPSAGAGPCHRG